MAQERARRDEAFMRRALDAHGDAVYRVALGLTHSAADAQDVAQDTFMRLLTDTTAFHDEDHLRAWLLRVAINRCRELWRTPWERRVTGGDEALARRPDDRPGPEDEAVQSLKADPVWKALEDLPQDLREAAHLHYVEGLSPAEVARVLGCPAATARTRLFRARARMRRGLGLGGGMTGAHSPAPNGTSRIDTDKEGDHE